MNTARYALIALLITTMAGTAQAAWGDRAAAREQFKERVQKVIQMRQHTLDFFAAKEAGNRDAAMKAADDARKVWNELPDNWRHSIEEKHPGTADRVDSLREEYDLPDDVAVAGTAAAGKQTVTSQGTWTKDGQTVTHQGTATRSGGKTASVDATFTKDGDTVTKDATITTKNGKTVDQDVTWAKDKEAGTVTRDGTSTSGTKSVTSHDTWQKDGKTVQHDGSSATSGGKTATRADTWAKDGTSVTHDGSRTGLGGGTSTKQDTWNRDGNTVTHQGTATATAPKKTWTPSYKDDSDIFGGRPPPQKSAKTTAKPAGGAKRK